MFKEVTHVIFDVDGLLLNTEDIYFDIVNSITQKYGKEYTIEVRKKVLGTVEHENVRIIIEELDLPVKHEDFLTEYKSKIMLELQHPKLMPGAEELVRHLHKHNIPIAIATSSSEEANAVKMQDHEEICKLFHHMVCGTSDPDVKQGKPAPDIFLVAAARFPDNPDPSKCLVFEDAPGGVVSAVTAGMQCVMVPEDFIPEELRRPATLVLKSLADFEPKLFGLPPRDS